MINLMYVVLMAMLAMNVSTQVLDGFSIVEESLQRSTDNSAKENQSIYGNFAEQMKSNPEKVHEWFEKATAVKRMSDSLYNFAQELKVEIVREADGADGDIHNIERKDDLEAASHVMLAPGTGKGKKLFDAINSFRERILKMVPDAAQHKIIAGNLSTTLPKNAKTMGKNWQEYMFEDMPVAAAVTLLTKLQNDVRYAEGEVLHTLVANIDMKDIRVNKLSAFVIPNAQTIVRGDKFSAQIVMAAVDTTQQPKIYIGGRQMNLRNNTYEIVTGRTGEFNLAGYITMQNGQGDVIRRDFTQKYTVVDPSATVSADLMNVLYAGYTNPISISIPGVPLNKVTASMSGRTGQVYRPSCSSRQGRHHHSDVDHHRSSAPDGTVHVPRAQTAGSDGISRHRHQPLSWRRTRQGIAYGFSRSEGCNRRRTPRYSVQGAQLRDSILRQYGKCRSYGFCRSFILGTPEECLPRTLPQPPLLYQPCHCSRS